MAKPKKKTFRKMVENWAEAMGFCYEGVTLVGISEKMLDTLLSTRKDWPWDFREWRVRVGKRTWGPATFAFKNGERVIGIIETTDFPETGKPILLTPED